MILFWLLVYAALMVGLGLWIGRQVKSSSDFFVASRQLNTPLLFATLLAANIGAGSTVGAASLGYRDGLAAWWWVGSAALGTFLLSFWIGPKLWTIARDHDLKTVGDYLELRYGPALRGLVAGLLWLGTLAILAGQLIALAWVLSVVAGIPKIAGCLIGALVMVIYFTAGGLLTSAWVNLVQLVVLLLGFALALPLVLRETGGLRPLLTADSSPDYGSFWQNGASGFSLIFLLAPAFMISPGLLQKVYGARDLKTVRRGTAATAVVLILFAFLPVLLGMAARLLHPDLQQADQALPTLLAVNLPGFFGGLGLAAVVSAEISTADALLFMLATSFSQDLYRRFWAPQANDKQLLRAARAAAIVGGALAVGLALVLPDVIGALRIFYSILTVCLFVPILAGLFWPAVDRRAAFAAIGAGITTLAAAKLELLVSWTTLPADLLALLASVAGLLVAMAWSRSSASKSR